MKYGTHIWVVYETRGEVTLYDDFIIEIIINEDSLLYMLKECWEEVKEENVILYEDKDRLYEVICEKMNNIREGEKNEGKNKRN